MRKLASVQKIKDIEPIKGADAIELATINNWKVVVAKNVGHEVGDLVIYCEIDSFLPIEPEFEFLRKSSYKKMSDDSEGFRLKTIKLRGQISQGLIIPLKDAYDIYKRRTPNLEMEWFEGLDVSEMIGIVKYEPPMPPSLAGTAKGMFPGFIPKTDEERIQNFSDEMYEEWKSESFYVTEKLDGSSTTIYCREGEFGVCSRNIDLMETEENTQWKIARKFDLEEKMKSLGSNIAIQGEMIGEGIQKNRYKLRGQSLRVFNLFFIDEYRYATLQETREICEKLGLEMVPVLEEKFTLPESVEDLLEYAQSKSTLSETEREGIVVRNTDKKVSFKVISNKFLMKNEE